MNLLLTGASGFVGTNLISTLRLDKDYNDVTLFALTSKKIEDCICIDHKKYLYTKDDLIKNGLNHVDAVIHLGAFSPKSSGESDDFHGSLSNITNTLHLIDNLPNNPSKFIYISSTSIYSNKSNIIDESSDEIPESIYGYSKLYCEKMIEKYCITNNIRYQILRVGPIYGAGEESYRRLIPITLKRLGENKSPIVMNNGSVIRSFIHVSDVSYLILKALNLKAYFGPINIVTNQGYKIMDLIQLCIAISKRNVKPELIYSEMDYRDQCFNNEKMQKLLGSEHVQIKDGLYEEYINILKQAKENF